MCVLRRNWDKLFILLFVHTHKDIYTRVGYTITILLCFSQSQCFSGVYLKKDQIFETILFDRIFGIY